MSSPFLAEITMFGFNFAPKGWAFCAGQLLPISQNTALFSLLGTMYGGDGKSTFALPNMQNNGAVNMGQGPGLSDYVQGEVTGSSTVQVLDSEMPSHSHTFNANSTQATLATSNGNMLGLAQGGTKQNTYNANIYSVQPNQATTGLNPLAISLTGGNQPHNNMQPYLGLNFCIALQGVYPARG